MLRKKLSEMSLVFVSATALDTSIANAEWKKDDIGW